MTVNHLSEEQKRHFLKDFSRGFIAYCGFEAFDLRSGSLSSRLAVRDRHRQQDGFVHAGLISTMADHTAGYAAFTMVPHNHRILTIEFKINFLRPASGDELICRARVVKPGKRVLVCESDVFDQQPGREVHVARFLASMASVPASDLST